VGTWCRGSAIQLLLVCVRACTATPSSCIAAQRGISRAAPAEFEARRALGVGRVLTQEVLARAEGRKLADVLPAKVSGLHGNNYGGERATASSRGVLSLQPKMLPSGDGVDIHFKQARPDCYVQVVVDGMIRYKGTVNEKLFDINSIAPEQLAGLEFYTTSEIPPQFNGTGSPCGTLVLWTRMRY
jgi:hypothetical protein